MNIATPILTPIKLTAAETALVDAFTRQVGELPGDGMVLVARDNALDGIKTEGLPTRRVESWHYTDLRALLRAVPADTNAPFIDQLPGLVSNAFVLPVLNGKPDVKTSIGGVTIGSFRDRLMSDDHAHIEPRGSDDAIGRINTSFVRDGLVIDIADGTTLEQPLELQLSQSAGQSHTRFAVSFGAQTKGTVIERHSSLSDDASLVSSVSDVSVGDGADILWIIFQAQGPVDTHLAQMNFKLGANAKLTLYVINTGGKLVRQEVHGVTVGEGSDFQMRGINLLGGDTHTDVTFTLGHDVPNTTSTEIIRNVIFDRARGVFQGQIRVAPDAQKTDARMACNTLLMSDDADFSAKPELEIFADDVQCGHGATVIDINATHLYYLMARGIPENKARGLLINAFVAEIVEELDDEQLVEALEDVISAWLDKHA